LDFFLLKRSEILGSPLSFVINTFGAYFLRNQLREKNTIVGQTNLL
jgi:hypothetical protein